MQKLIKKSGPITLATTLRNKSYFSQEYKKVEISYISFHIRLIKLRANTNIIIS